MKYLSNTIIYVLFKWNFRLGGLWRKNVEQPEPVFLFTGDLVHDNAKIIKFTSDQQNAITSDSSHFSISHNEIIVNKSGIYEIHFIDSLKSTKGCQYGFVPQILKMVSKPIRKSQTWTPLIINGIQYLCFLLHNWQPVLNDIRLLSVMEF